MVGVGNFAAGLLRGMAQSKQRKAQAERQAAQDKRDKQKFDLDMMNKKFQMKQFEMTQKLYDQYFSESSGETKTEASPVQENLPKKTEPEVNFSSNFGHMPTEDRTMLQNSLPQPGIVDQIVKGQSGLPPQNQPQQPQIENMSPMQAEVFKILTKVDAPSAIRNITSQKSLDLRKAEGIKRDEDRDASRRQNQSQHEDNLNQKKVEFAFNKGMPVWKKKTIDGVPHEVAYTKMGKLFPGLEPVPMGGKKPMSAESAKPFNMANSGLSVVAKVRKGLVKPDGTIDRKLLASFATKMPFTKGRTLKQNYEDATSAKLRVETGAAFGASEIVNINSRFVPSVLDEDAGIISKLDRMETFLSSTIELLDPNKIYRPGTDIVTSTDGRQWVIEPPPEKNEWSIERVE